jgi:hypothetical protein
MKTGTTSWPNVLLVGGSGFFGRLLLGELLRDTGCDVTIAGRDWARLAATRAALEAEHAERVILRECDLGDADGARQALRDVRIAVCAGPSSGPHPHLAQACFEAGVPYVDLSDDRAQVTRLRGLAVRVDPTAEGPAMAPGWSAVPALSAALVAIGADDLDSVESIDVAVAPGNAHPRSTETVSSLLRSAGRPFRVLRQGVWCTVDGWSDPAEFSFPEPIGRRAGRLVDVPDCEIFPHLFGARRVEFRVGSEVGALNGAVDALAWMRRHGVVRNWSRYAPLVRTGMRLFAAAGTSAGAIGVEIEGRYGRLPLRKRLSIVAQRDGERIPVLPAAYLVSKLARDPDAWHGLVPLNGWIDRDDLEHECARRGFQLFVEEE